MVDPIVISGIGQFIAFVILLKYMQVQLRDTRLSVEAIVKDTYTKAETKELIDMKQAPLEVKLDNIQNDLTDIKLTLVKLLDAKIK